MALNLQKCVSAVVGGDNCSPGTSDLLDAFSGSNNSSFSLPTKQRRRYNWSEQKKICEIKASSTWPVIEFQCTRKSLNWVVNTLNHLSLNHMDPQDADTATPEVLKHSSILLKREEKGSLSVGIINLKGKKIHVHSGKLRSPVFLKCFQSLWESSPTENPQKKVLHCVSFVCVFESVTAFYQSAHTHSLLPWDKRGQTVNHCWCDDGQQTGGTVHKAAFCRGWHRLAPVSHTQREKSKAHVAFLQHTGIL